MGHANQKFPEESPEYSLRLQIALEQIEAKLLDHRYILLEAASTKESFLVYLQQNVSPDIQWNEDVALLYKCVAFCVFHFQPKQ